MTMERVPTKLSCLSMWQHVDGPKKYTAICWKPRSGQSAGKSTLRHTPDDDPSETTRSASQVDEDIVLRN